eukprot:450333_1
MLILYTMAEAVVAPTTMKTIICSAHGASKDVLQLKSDVSIPTIEKPTYVLVKILYASLNAVDYKEVTGLLGPVTSKKPPFVTGIVFAGRVIAKGTDVCLKDRLEIGDLVYGQCWNSTHGSFAEYCVVDGSKVYRMPISLTPLQAASIPLTAQTSLQVILKMALKQTDKLLIF